MKKYILIGLILALSLISIGTAFALPLTVNEVQIDDITLTSGANRVSLDRNAEYSVEIQFTPQQAIENLELEAFISGYEYNYDDKISDGTPADDYDANITYKRTLSIRIPKDVEEDSYKIRVLFSDRDGDTLIKDYNLKLDPVKNAVEIVDIILSQEILEAGNVLTAVIRLANLGEDDEEDIRVELSVPELGLMQVEYIDEIAAEDEESSEELLLRIPTDAKPGVYTLNVRADYDNRHASVFSSATFSVKNNAKALSGPKTVIVVGSQIESASAAKPGIFPVSLTNNLRAQAFTLAVEGVDGWADAEINPVNTALLESGETAQFAVILTPNRGVEAGTRVFTVNFYTGGKALKQIPLTVNVLPTSQDIPYFAVAIAGIIILALLAALLFFRKINNHSKDSVESKKQQINTYY